MRPNKWWVFATVSCGSLMASIDVSVVNLALPALRDQYHIGLAQVEWVVLSYLLMLTSLLLTMGRLADVMGRNKLYNLGFVVFTAGSMLCGLAPNIPALVGFRGVQAVGSAMLISSSTAILLDAFPTSQRGQALGLMSTVFALGNMIGPTLGGGLLTWFGWRSIFFVNVPVGLVGMTLAFLMLPRQAAREEGRFDIAGSILVGIAIVGLLLAINTGQQEGWTPRVIAMLAGAVALSIAFVVRQVVAPFPLLRFGLFKTPGFTNALIGQTMQTMCGSSNLLLLPFFLVSLQGRTEAQAGLILLASSITSAFISPLGGWLSDRIEIRWVATAGATVMMIGYVLMSGARHDWRVADVVMRIIVLSVGTGLFISPNASAAYQYVRSADRGQAVGTLAFIRNLGFTFGTAVAGSVWTLRRLADAHSMKIDPASIAAQVAGLHDTYLVIAGFAMIALLASVARPKVGTSDRSSRDSEAAVAV
ncbi:MAG: MFS transporter [Chloroflexota bacterium]|nr:MFS transporter [Chloroflexota bacterium]